jgi:hypothetical protein
VTGTVTAYDASATVLFCYGTSELAAQSCALSVTVTPSTLSGASPINVSASLTGLTPGTKYYVVLFASNSQANYVGTPAQTATTAKISQTVAFTSSAPTNATSGMTYVPVVSSTSGLTPVISVTTSGGSVCTVSGTSIVLTGSGTCTITATQDGNAAYAAAAPVSQTITVADDNQLAPLVPAPVNLAPVGTTDIVIGTLTDAYSYQTTVTGPTGTVVGSCASSNSPSCPVTATGSGQYSVTSVGTALGGVTQVVTSVIDVAPSADATSLPSNSVPVSTKPLVNGIISTAVVAGAGSVTLLSSTISSSAAISITAAGFSWKKTVNSAGQVVILVTTSHTVAAGRYQLVIRQGGRTITTSFLVHPKKTL